MSSSTSQSKPKFLFDENVDDRLKRFLKQQNVDVISKPKRLSNGKLAEFSKSEQSVLVTNDEDFIEFTEEEIFSIVWLRIPQRKIESSIRSFSELLKSKSKPGDFEGFLIVLNEGGKFKSYPLKSSKSVRFTK